MIRTSTIGFPTIGRQRELKNAVEASWAGKISEAELAAQADQIKRTNFAIQKQAGIDVLPSNDFSYYDRVLDTSVMFGQIPARFVSSGRAGSLAQYFAMARGSASAEACEMTKWFDTNYHYIVPEISGKFTLTQNQPLEAYRWAKKELGLQTKPTLIGLYTYLRLAKPHSEKQLLEWMEALAPVYAQALEALSKEGIAFVQIEEPALVLGEDAAAVKRAGECYAQAARAKGKTRWVLQTYFGHLAEHWEILKSWPFDGIGLDVARESKNRELLAQRATQGKFLALGLVSGRNVWRSHLPELAAYLKRLQEQGMLENAWLEPTTSLLHLPYTTAAETTMADDLRSWLAFAEERLEELRTLKQYLEEGESAVAAAFGANQALRQAMKTSPKIHRPQVAERVQRLSEKDFARSAPFEERSAKQKERLGLPPFPTTTIGSFPQTQEVRQTRAKATKGELSPKDYEAFIENQIRELIRKQEEIGLDVLVHGEFERTDMVEFFGQKLEGFIHSANGWVQSYGSRCVRPPIIFGDAARPKPMTTREIFFAQRQTRKPVKGMLTGPVTILQWSFVREDIPREEVAYQIALALRDETLDLEKGGIQIIQVDEPAFREGLPLKKPDRPAYLRWAVRAFRLATSGVQPHTQIHTHMCYSEFNEIIRDIQAMDADVISIENARSHEELLEAFRTFRYDRDVGPGVYDIHSPRIPSVEEITHRLEAVAQYIDPGLLWVNPDCGLKTRDWKETLPSLKNMVQAAQTLRQRSLATSKR